MVTGKELVQIKNLYEAGLSPREITDITGRSLGTIYKYIERFAHEHAISSISHSYTPSKKLVSHAEYLEGRMKNGIYNSRKLFDEILVRGYRGGYGLVNAFVKNHNFKIINTKKRSVQVLTGPGEQAQVDWGSCGKILLKGKKERLYVFVYVLSYSRALYIEFVIRQNEKTFQHCHINAFKKLGIPRQIAYDNIKTVVLSRKRLPDRTTKDRLNPNFKDFALFYGFQPFLCPPYWPRSKGKVERSVAYVKRNFLADQMIKKSFVSLEDLNMKAYVWVDKIAQQRIHGSTGQQPQKLWREEKAFLRFPDPARNYTTSPFLERMCTQDAMVLYKGCFYSIPLSYARRKVYVHEANHHGVGWIEIYYDDLPIAKHMLSKDRNKWIQSKEHLEEAFVPTGKNTKKARRRWKEVKVSMPQRDLTNYNKLIKKKNHGKKKN